jgi:hypothetical protein
MYTKALFYALVVFLKVGVNEKGVIKNDIPKGKSDLNEWGKPTKER